MSQVVPTATAGPSAQPAERDLDDSATEFRGAERYEVLGEHGRGGLGRVSRAVDHNLGRDVAIKELIVRSATREKRFLREARITARLEHPGIVPVYEAGRWADGTPFYAMKLVAGRPLRALIAERATVAERIALLHHVIAVADAMAYAHARRIIHRDLKPANVIVGAFGETIVIDWGLAKALDGADEPTSGDGAQATPDDLTNTGSVLGTPAYMAPEQARGEAVDQRADVYAIGAMLWELCALECVPPADRAQRNKLLRRNGIDPDLITILNHALQDDPARRYADAGALAADLKAFKSGARIAARSYSVPAAIEHWARRHRALTFAIVAGAALAIAVAALYVRGLAIARARTEVERDRQVLEHAELLLQSDPTAAFALLADYHGSDGERATLLRAQAEGLGVAQLRAHPHAQMIYYALHAPNGDIITLGGDGAIARTGHDGHSRIIARDFVPQFTYIHARRRHLLAYACSTGACVLDLERDVASTAPGLDGTPTCVWFSPDETRLAAITPRGEIAIWRIGGTLELERRLQRADGESLRLVDNATLAIESHHEVEIFHLDGARDSLVFAGASHLAFTAPDSTWIAARDTDGGIVAADARSHEVKRFPDACKSNATMVLVLPRARVAYACQDGDVGAIELATGRRALLAHLEGGIGTLDGLDDGRYLAIGGTSGKVALHDFTTRATHTFLGHGERVYTTEPPSAQFPELLSGDIAGELRAWRLPSTFVQPAVTTPLRLAIAVPLSQGGPLLAVSQATEIPWLARDGERGVLTGHLGAHTELARDPRRAVVALYGTDDQVELWSFATAPSRAIRSGHGPVTAAAFTDDGALLLGTRDGALLRWMTEATQLGALARPIASICTAAGAEFVRDDRGALWQLEHDALRPIATVVEPLTALACTSRWLAIGTAAGQVRVYDVVARAWHTVHAAATPIDQLAFAPDGQQLAFAIAGRLHLVATQTGAPALHLPAARRIAFSPDGAWLAAVGNRGGIWLYHRGAARWRYVPTDAAALTDAVFSDDSALLVVTDPSGRALTLAPALD